MLFLKPNTDEDGAEDGGNGGAECAAKHRSMSPFYAPVATGAKRGREAWAQLAWAARLTEFNKAHSSAAE